MKTRIGARSDVGRVREGNEDSYVVQEPLFGVADGMGGHLAGDIASQTAVEIITTKARDGASAQGLQEMVQAANSAIWDKAQSDPSLRGMGTTCTLLLLGDERVHIAHVGDSRAYQYRDRQLSQLTEDHTLVQRMVEEGRLRRDEASRHPQRSIITRALGVDANVRVDTQAVGAQPGDRFILCSDGLTAMLDDAQIERVLGDESDPQLAVDRLVELANKAGGEDNITVVIIDIDHSERPAGGESEALSPDSPRDAWNSGASLRNSPGPRSPSSAGARLDVAEATYSVSRKTGPRWGRIAVALLLVLAILAASAYIAFRFLVLERSYFVGVNEAGMVTIYQGLPDELAGFTLSEEEQVTDLAAADVPEFLQDNLEAGIREDSLAAAEDRVADLEARTRDAEVEQQRRGREPRDRTQRKKNS